MKRRKFITTATMGTTALLTTRLPAAAQSAKSAGKGSPALRYNEWLAARHKRVMSAEHVDAFLQPSPNNQWAKFDPELGYVPSDSIQRDGVDGSRTPKPMCAPCANDLAWASRTVWSR
jgi:hypothetical protein